MKGVILVITLGVIVIGLLGIYVFVPAPRENPESAPMPQTTMNLTSPAFKHGEAIPAKFTCDGENISPELLISDVPGGAKSLALIMEDPDVPMNIREDGMWDHWVVWNIPPQTTRVEEGVEPEGIHGITTSETLKYGGPCPPDREHRYFFKIFALKELLDLPEGAARRELMPAMKGHIIEQAELVGKYSRGKK